MKQIIARGKNHWLSTLFVPAAALSGCVIAEVQTTETARPPRDAVPAVAEFRPYDRELAQLLVKLELRTRAVIAKHYGSADLTQRAWLAKNLLLPAAVADGVFHEVVPATTGNRAWVKMVVDEPRNPHNAADATAIALMHEVRTGRPCAARATAEAYYYAEPIRAAATCLACHGDREGDPDPFFPQYHKNGWQEGQIVGAVVARVAPRT